MGNFSSTTSARTELTQLGLIAAQNRPGEEAPKDSEQNGFSKVLQSISRIWVWLMMIPYFKKALHWQSKRQIQVCTLQDRCIEKAHRELKLAAERERFSLAWECCQVIEQLKTRSISDCEKQSHQDYCIAENLRCWKSTQRILQSDLVSSEKLYRSMRNVKELRRHLTLTRQPVV